MCLIIMLSLTVWFFHYLYKMSKAIQVKEDYTDVHFYSEIMCNGFSLVLHAYIVAKVN